MYPQFFKLNADPFRLTPDYRFCYAHSQYEKARQYMAYAFRRAEGFVLVTGRPGTGKTTLIADLVESLAGENVAVANLVSTQLVADDLLRMVAFAYGLEVEGLDKSVVLRRLAGRLLSWRKKGRRALLIVDEAQDLNSSALEELRLLTNMLERGKPLLQIFLLGQPELRGLIQKRELEQVHQRIIAATNLEALSEGGTRNYVEHRLRVVGWRNDPAISNAVYLIIHRFSEGLPRRINLICSRLLLRAAVEQQHRITVADARAVVAELQEEQLSREDLLRDDLFFAEDKFEESEPAPAADVERRPTSVPQSLAVTDLSPPSASGLVMRRQLLELEPGPANESPAADTGSGMVTRTEAPLEPRAASPVWVGSWLARVALVLLVGAIALVAGVDRFL